MYLPEAFQKKMKAILGEEYDDFQNRVIMACG